MNALRAVALFGILAALGFSEDPPSAASVAHSLSRVTLDPDQTFIVRDLHLRRGDVSFYFSDGLLSFASEVNGKRIGAVFTTAGVDAGDAEILVLPPQTAERASLASFAKTPNLDEHFLSVILFFTDGTADELLTQVSKAGLRKAPDLHPELRSSAERILRNPSAQVKTRMVSAILDRAEPADGFFYAAVHGRELGSFNVLYEPKTSEPVTVGRVVDGTNEPPHFELWTSYRPRNAGPYRRPDPVISQYSIEATVQPDLSIVAIAGFEVSPQMGAGRVLSFDISRRMQVESATVDGEPVEAFQQSDAITNPFNSDGEFLLILKQGFDPSRSHRVQIRYSGSIISQVAGSSYFVSERNLWYPHTETMLTNFDLRFHCPARFQMVSTGDLIEESVEGGVRTIHRRTTSPQQLAGFNLGEYQAHLVESSSYRIQSYADQGITANLNGIPGRAAEVLQHYTTEWLALPNRTLAITPIPGDFGQGFPGIIYLARTAYIPESDRPAGKRSEQDRIFFSDMLLPHEIAHQWWGNLVTAEGYRSEWLMEAMANDSALEFITRNGGEAVTESVLEQYRKDLGLVVEGKTVESDGPVDFGSRIMTTAGLPAWQAVIYGKGTWILRMLRARMGDASFGKLQAEILRSYAGKPISNEDFRKAASGFIPASQPDKDLSLFFETWIYGTGIPKISSNRAGTKLEVSGVNDSFLADLPLRCKSKGSAEQVRWIRIEAGHNSTPAPGCKLPSRLDFLYFPE
ncbi:MAG: peptidase rane alanine aminopeptidase, partial [Bryobacterales bacterium]|nr:peptidase rane alanine aminopeptidase [Bryobacterales bacterium]